MKKRTSLTARKEATLKDVAREANVSTMTAWRVLNGESNVKQSTRDKVQKTADRINYRPNTGARLLAGTQSYQLLMLYNNPNIGWMGKLMIGAMNACRCLGYHLIVEGLDYQSGFDRKFIENLIDTSTIDGVVLPPPTCFDENILQVIKEAEIPCVRLAGSSQDNIEPRVSIDNFAAASELTNYLISIGHEKIAIIKGPSKYRASKLRYEGYCAALKENGIPFTKDYVEQGLFDVQSGVIATRNLLKIKPRPTAIFALNDDMASGALSAAQENGLKVPQDLSVAGFDDAPVALSVWPHLTTVQQPLEKMGGALIDVLANHIKMTNSRHPITTETIVELEYSLVIRGSTGKCPINN